MLGPLALPHRRSNRWGMGRGMFKGWSVTYNSLPEALHGHSLEGVE